VTISVGKIGEGKNDGIKKAEKQRDQENLFLGLTVIPQHGKRIMEKKSR
jgi:hypothetical protein